MTPPRLRILVLVTDAFGGYGGIAQYNRDFLTALCQDDRVAEVIALPRLVPNPLEPLPDKLVFEVAGAGHLLQYLSRLTHRLLSQPRFDLICCGHIHLLPLALAAGRLLKRPVWLLTYGIEVWRPTGRIFVDRWVSQVSRLLSISEVTLGRFLAWSRYPRERCALLPNAIHLEHYGPGPKPASLVQRYGLTNRRVLLTFGRLESQERAKGFDEILELLPSLAHDIPDVTYVIAGDGSDRERLQQKVRDLHLTAQVVFTGLVAEEDKADLYRLADAYVMPSRGEGFGFVLLEAMACGIPVVASKSDGGREAVREGALGILVDPDDPADIRRGILAALAQPRQVPPGLAYFSFDQFSQRLGALLDPVAASQATH